MKDFRLDVINRPLFVHGGAPGSINAGPIMSVQSYSAKYDPHYNFATYPSYQSLSLSTSVVADGGFNFEIGGVWGGGQYRSYITFGPSVGIDASLGVLHKRITPQQGFTIDNYSGYGGSFEGGIGPLDFVFLGGDNVRNAFASPYGKTYTEQGIGLSAGSPLGLTRNFGYTWFY